jgi:F0F1-type ATP synthase assembly protein I
MPQRSAGQQARLWLLSLCGAVPGAIVVYLTDSFLQGAAVFLAVVVVLGFLLHLYEKRKHQRD